MGVLVTVWPGIVGVCGKGEEGSETACGCGGCRLPPPSPLDGVLIADVCAALWTGLQRVCNSMRQSRRVRKERRRKKPKQNRARTKHGGMETAEGEEKERTKKEA